jgi:hypothetical protein
MWAREIRDIIVCSICATIAVALLVISGSQLDYINSQRQQMKLIVDEPLKNAPPSLAFATVAMGAFRGLVVDILWMRAEALKEEGQFFDARQLADWITTLQPRFAAVWDFQAWNMAYNISVAIPMTQPDERWQWVKNGYELLRDQAIPMNPRNVMLYHRLAFIFQHKIGAVSDDAHRYYKLQMAQEMAPLVGGARYEDFVAMAEAPKEFEQIARDPNVAPLIEALKSADQAFADNDRFTNNYLSLRQDPARYDPEAFRVIDDFRGTTGLRLFDIFAKAYQLRKTWKLDPEFMHEVNNIYGPVDWTDPNKRLPLDWRHPDVHAIYWCAKGLRMGTDEDSTARGDLFRSGKIHIWKTTGDAQPSSQVQAAPDKDIFYQPDLRMFESYHKQQLRVIHKYDDPNHPRYTSHQIGHRNMLKNALFSFYQAGHKGQAQKVYDLLRKYHPRPEFNVSLPQFARNRFLDELKNLDIFNVKELVLMLLRESYFLYAIRSDNEAFGRESLAKEIFDFYITEFPDKHRIDLPPFNRLKYLALRAFLNDRRFRPDLRRALLKRIELERPKLHEMLVKQEELNRQQTQPQQ